MPSQTTRYVSQALLREVAHVGTDFDATKHIREHEED